MASYEQHPPRFPLTVWVWPPLLLLIAVGIVWWRFGGSLMLASTPTFNAPTVVDAQPRDVTPRGTLAEDEQNNISIYKKCAPSVVHITSITRRSDPISLNVQQVPRGTGSGFIWRDTGYIVTNYHVVEAGNAWDVTLHDHTTYKAQLVGTFPDKDLAVLQIDAPKEKLRPISVGTSGDLQVGQKVFAIGNPFGLDQTLTTGIISALDREIESVTGRPIRSVIQTDAAINPGNSGGPLIDSSGHLIGVNTAIASPTGAYAGIGFAIPVDEVNRIIPEIITHGKVVRAGLGVTVASDQMIRDNDLQGVLILNVQPEGAAAKAGLQPTRRNNRGTIVLGDQILSVNGKEIKTAKDLFAQLEQFKVGDTVQLHILRGDQTLDVPVSLGPVS